MAFAATSVNLPYADMLSSLRLWNCVLSCHHYTLLSVSAWDWSFLTGPTSRWLDTDYCCYVGSTDPCLSNFVCGLELPRPALYWNWPYRSRVEMCRLNMCAVGCRPVTAKNHQFLKIRPTSHLESAWIMQLSFSLYSLRDLRMVGNEQGVALWTGRLRYFRLPARCKWDLRSSGVYAA